MMAEETRLKNIKRTIAQTLTSFDSAYPLVDLYVRFQWPDLRTKYVQVELSVILLENCKSLDDVENVTVALNILMKYAVNLLSPLKLRPARWNVIDFLNPIFNEKVRPIKGTLVILRKLGYTAVRSESMAFPPNTEPNTDVVAEITVELMAGKTELQYYIDGKHPYPALIEKYLVFTSRSKSETENTRIGQISSGVQEMALSNLKDREPIRKMNNDLIPEMALPGNIPLMVLDQVVSIAPGDATSAAEVLGEVEKCDICGEALATKTCRLCDNKNLCTACDERWHLHPKRRTHERLPYGSQGMNLAQTGKNGNASVEIGRSGKLVESSAAQRKWEVGLPYAAQPPVRVTNGSAPSAMREVASPGVATSTPSRVLPPPSSSEQKSSSVLPSVYKPSIWNRTIPVASPMGVKEQQLDVDDLQAILSKARHPPAFYVPPTSIGVMQLQNGETSAEMKTATPVLDSRKISKQSLLSENAGFLQRLGPTMISGVGGGEQNRLSHSNLLPKSERTLGRSASAFVIATGASQGGNHASAETSFMQLYYNCETCTFKNLYSAEQRNKICSVCGKTNDNAKIYEDRGDDNSKGDVSAVKVAVTSPNHLTRAVSAFEPRNSRPPLSGQSSIERPEFVSKFVEIQDEIYKEKKEAWAKFQREEGNKGNAAQTSTLPSSHSVNTGPHQGNFAFGTMGNTGARSKFENAVEPKEPGTSKQRENTSLPVDAYSIDRQPYRSKFVDSADEIYLEKKAAQERFLKSQNSEGQLSESEPNLIDHVEFNEMRFQAKVIGAPATNVNVLGGNWQLPKRTESRLEKQEIHDLSLGNGNLNRIEKLAREKNIQDMYSNGMTVVRLMKVAEGYGILEAELDCILALCGQMDPYSYFMEKWLVSVEAVCKNLQERSIISKTSFPQQIVRLSLSESRGNVDLAVDLFIGKWRERVDAILSDCSLENTPDNRRHVISVLDAAEGDVEAAKTVVIRDKFQKTIWNDLAQAAMEDGAAIDNDIYQRTTKHLNEELAKRLVDATEPRERRIRMIFAEADLPGWMRAENVLTILEEPSLIGPLCNLNDIVDAVKNRGTVDESRQFLQQNCEICYDAFPSRLIKSMGCCQCKICCDCTKHYFEVVIRERFVRNLVCPVCGLPDIDTSEQTETHFQFLLLMLRNLVSNEVYELFQMKLRDWNLMMEPSFRWCASNDCKSGFLIDPEQHQNKINCPHCQKPMCQQCKKPWEEQHEGLTCDEFQSWKENNDPEVQALGLARHLEENGIECPECKCRYSLAKGGCMHFTCIQCRHEFCSGCLRPFKRGQNCGLLRSCAKAGLHCHHPRDCLFYLRDRDISELQKLLQDKGFTYDTEPSQTRLLAGPTGQRCSVMEQKQTQSGFKDEPCGKEVPANFAGLCEIHYKEYLVGLINKNGIDPISIMSLEELMVLVKRAEKEKEIPKKTNKTDKEYKELLQKIVQEKLPLPQRRHHGDTDQSDYSSKTTRWPTVGLPMIRTEEIGFSELELTGRNYQFDGDANDVAQDDSAADGALGMLAPTDHHHHINCALSKHRKKDSGYSSFSSTFLQNNGTPENDL